MATTSTSSTSTESNGERFIETLLSQVDEGSIRTIIELQKKSYDIEVIHRFSRLMRFEKTNEMLVNCCLLSANRLQKTRKDLAENKKLILEMKSDLESIFRRIRLFKQNCTTKYADIYKHFEQQYRTEEDDE